MSAKKVLIVCSHYWPSIGGAAILGIDKPQFAAAIRAAVSSGDYDACFLIQDPKGVVIWSLDGLTPPASTRLLIQPIINEEGYRRWQDNADFKTRLAAILSTADAALTMTRDGPGHR